MLEKLLMETLNIKTRKEINSDRIRPLDLNSECDLAYIRCQFKRFIARNKTVNTIKAYYTWDNAYTITRESFVKGWEGLEGRENIIKSLRTAIKESKS